MMLGTVGLDVSLSNTGMCHIPGGWDGSESALDIASYKTVKAKDTFGQPMLLAREEAERYLRIANRIVGFVKKHDVKHVAIEHYAFSTVRSKSGKPIQSSSVSRLAELGGTVKTQVLLACRTPVVPVPSSAGRKIVVGSLSRGNVKEQVQLILESFGLSFSNLDEMDAFVTAYARYCEVNSISSRFIKKNTLY